MRHCIVTEELAGLNKSGGIGACANGLAGALTSFGCNTDILITDLSCHKNPDNNILKICESLFKLNDYVGSKKNTFLPVDQITKSYAVYMFLKERKYDVVHFNDWLGSGFYTAMARKQGLFGSCIITHLHGSSEWVRQYNKQLPSIESFETEAIERSQIENSDVVICPSNYLISWYRQHGCNLPETRQINWLLPNWRSLALNEKDILSTRALEANSVKELIFFGRHERRKGFELFINAIKKFPPDIQPDLTFIGRFDKIDREFTASYIFRNLENYGGRIRLYNELDQEGAIKKIQSAHNALTIMPSLIENSPCVVGECFSAGVPFLATDVGGTSELIAAESAQYCLAKPNPEALMLLILKAIKEGLPILKSTLRPTQIETKWKNCLNSLESLPSTDKKAYKKPLVSICLTHYERPTLLSSALKALEAQTYDNIEIIIVDDGSKKASSLSFLSQIEKKKFRFPIRIIYSENRYLGAARNLAASYANGEFLLFHDDDNIAEKNEIEIFVRAAITSGADVLTSQCWVFRGSDDKGLEDKKLEYFPIGIGGIFSFFRNRFGDANSLIRASIFKELGGFTELYGVGFEDWELFLRAYLRGYKTGVVPEPLFNYRVQQTSMLATGNIVANTERIYKLLDQERVTTGSELVRLVQRDEISKNILDRKWSELERSRHGELHQQMTAVDPNSEDAKRMLTDLVFALGRVGDALELGLANFEQRARLLNAIASLKNIDDIRSKYAVIEPDDNGDEVIVVRGWGFDKKGMAFVPSGLKINGRWYSLVSCISCSRPDVNEHFGLDNSSNRGFLSVFKPVMKSGLKIPFINYQTIQTGRSVSASIKSNVPKETILFIDEALNQKIYNIDSYVSDKMKSIIIESATRGYLILFDSNTNGILNWELGKKLKLEDLERKAGKFITLLCAPATTISIEMVYDGG